VYLRTVPPKIHHRRCCPLVNPTQGFPSFCLWFLFNNNRREDFLRHLACFFFFVVSGVHVVTDGRGGRWQAPNGYTLTSWRTTPPAGPAGPRYTVGLFCPYSRSLSTDDFMAYNTASRPGRPEVHTFSKVPSTVTLCSKYTRALTVENLCREA
jgi:hypothetical protein